MTSHSILVWPCFQAQRGTHGHARARAHTQVHIRRFLFHSSACDRSANSTEAKIMVCKKMNP